MTDYFEVKTTHPRQHAEKLFGKKADAALAMQIKRENPQLYNELRADAVTLGLLGQSRREQIRELYGPKIRQFSAEEVAVRARISEQEARAFWNGIAKDAPAEIKKNDPARYAQMQLAGRSYGVLPGFAPTMVDADKEGLFRLADDIADQANLPRDIFVSHSQFADVLKQVADAKSEREKAGE